MEWQANPLVIWRTHHTPVSHLMQMDCVIRGRNSYIYFARHACRVVDSRLQRDHQAVKGPRTVCFVNSRTEKQTQQEASWGLQDEKGHYHTCWFWNFTAAYYWSYRYKSQITAELFEQTNTVSYRKFWEYSWGPICYHHKLTELINGPRASWV